VIVVIDSSIWISAMEFGGIPAAAVEKAILVPQMATCDQIVGEVVRNLSTKFGWEPLIVRDQLSIQMSDAMRIEIIGDVVGACRDATDDCILECAMKAGARLIITGDKDLLTLGEFSGIRIITARQYLDLPHED
jgi:putative PIN family toxin of toxin-antitoxin system